MQRKRNHTGIEQRGDGYRASVWSARDGKRIRKTFPTLAAAKAWRQDAQVALRRGELRAASSATLAELAETWVEGARSGAIRTRSGDRYKPSAIRTYEAALRLRVLPGLGASRLADITRPDLQDLVDRLVGEGHSASMIQTTIVPLKAICRREMGRGRLHVNPTTGLELPVIRGGRDRIADPAEAAALLAALPEQDRAIWATAMYAGMRRGELRALRVDRVDFDAGVIHVMAGWDAKAGEILTKGRNRRRVPIPAALRSILRAHLLRTGYRGRDLVFGRTATLPFDTHGLSERADAAWKDEKLKRITLHECRHTFASLMIAAGVNAKALSTYMGHANIAITLDRYGHLMPGNEEQAAGLLDAYLSTAMSSP